VEDADHRFRSFNKHYGCAAERDLTGDFIVMQEEMMQHVNFSYRSRKMQKRAEKLHENRREFPWIWNE
jgi:hypothetical protein